MKQLSASDWIQIVGIIVSILGSIIALHISKESNKISEKSVRIAEQNSLDNNRMIEESLRPQLVLYPETYLNSKMYLVLVVKNIGSTPCVIDDIYSNFDFVKNKFYAKQDIDPFENLIGLTLAPNQSKLIHLNGENIPNQNIKFHYHYSNSTKSYSDEQIINFKGGMDLVTMVNQTEGKELRNIYHTLFEIFRKSM